MNKLIISIVFLLLLPYQIALADPFIDKAMAAIKECYDKYPIIGGDTAECATNMVNSAPNPTNFRMKITSESPDKSKNSKFTIFMINDTGFMFYCVGIAGKQLVINSCASAQGKPLTAKQVLDLGNP
jgi:hypothetical protein